MTCHSAVLSPCAAAVLADNEAASKVVSVLAGSSCITAHPSVVLWLKLLGERVLCVYYVCGGASLSHEVFAPPPPPLSSSKASVPRVGLQLLNCKLDSADSEPYSSLPLSSLVVSHEGKIVEVLYLLFGSLHCGELSAVCRVPWLPP
jgi:hypothetical protein